MKCLTLNNNITNLMLQNIVKYAKISGNIRKKSWLYDRALKGYFNAVPKDDNESIRKANATLFANQLDSMIKVLDRQLGENWDFHLLPNFKEFYDKEKDRFCAIFTRFDFYIVLRFPEIKITNSKEESHTVKDLFVAIEVLKNPLLISDIPYLIMGDICGTRATYSFDEWFVGYNHSHLRKHKPDSFINVFSLQNFCIGSDTEIVEQKENFMSEFTPESFEMFILTIDSMVRWESLEGHPYMEMKDVKSADRIVDMNVYDGVYYDDYNRIKRFFTELNVDFVLNNNRYKIKRNKKFERMIHGVIKSWDNLTIKRNLFVNKIGKDYYEFNPDSNFSVEIFKEKFINEEGELPFYYHRDKKIIFNIEPNTKKPLNIDDYIVNPKFLNYAAKMLEERLYYKTVRKSTIEKYCKSTNA